MVLYRILADLVVTLHAAYVGFVIVGFLLILLGVALRWRWVRNFWFRAVHLAAIVGVCGEAVFGITCPLTTLEDSLRLKAGEATYAGDFMGYWAHELLFYEAPPWVFTLSYVVFAILVLGAFLLAPPRLPWRRANIPPSSSNA